MDAKTLNHNRLSFSLDTFTAIGSLVWYEETGSMLSLWRENTSGALFFLDWVDVDQAFNRWLVYEVTPLEVQRFLSKNLSRNTLQALKIKEMCLLDATDDWHILRLSPAPSPLPDDWLPEFEHFFDERFCPDIHKFDEFIENAPSSPDGAFPFNPTKPPVATIARRQNAA